MIHADTHGRGMPEIPGRIGNSGAMPCSRQEAARMEGIGIVLRRNEGSKGSIPYINTVTIGIKLRPRRRILQIITSLELIHPCPFDIRHGTKGSLPISSVIFANTLVSFFRRVSVDEPYRLPQRLHGIRIQFHTIQRLVVGASPVKIQSSVIIYEEIRVPEGEGPRDFLVRSMQNILGSIEVTGMGVIGSA